MKTSTKILLILTSIITFYFSAETVYSQQLTFEYDAAGNQIKRSWICVNCTTQPVMNVASLEKAITFKTEEKNQVHYITAYPNPVTEILTVAWPSSVHVKSLQVISLGGVVLSRQNVEPDASSATINFISIAAGGYLIRAEYRDGSREILKVIKQ